MKMVRSIIRINKEKASTFKPLVSPMPGYKPLGIGPAILFYEIEDGAKTKEGE